MECRLLTLNMYTIIDFSNYSTRETCTLRQGIMRILNNIINPTRETSAVWSRMFISVHGYVCIYICIHVYICVCVCAYVYICVCTCTCVCITHHELPATGASRPARHSTAGQVTSRNPESGIRNRNWNQNRKLKSEIRIGNRESEIRNHKSENQNLKRI